MKIKTDFKKIFSAMIIGGLLVVEPVGAMIPEKKPVAIFPNENDSIILYEKKIFNEKKFSCDEKDGILKITSDIGYSLEFGYSPDFAESIGYFLSNSNKFKELAVYIQKPLTEYCLWYWYGYFGESLGEEYTNDHNAFITIEKLSLQTSLITIKDMPHFLLYFPNLKILEIYDFENQFKGYFKDENDKKNFIKTIKETVKNNDRKQKTVTIIIRPGVDQKQDLFEKKITIKWK